MVEFIAMEDKLFVEIFTDGACIGNPGPGGFAALLKFGEHKKTVCGFNKSTTNQHMELSAVVCGLLALKKPCKVKITTDSMYIVNSVNKGWLNNWQRDGSVHTRPNSDLWLPLIELLKEHEVEFVWVKGHNGHQENEYCDTIATKMASRARQEKKFRSAVGEAVNGKFVIRYSQDI